MCPSSIVTATHTAQVESSNACHSPASQPSPCTTHIRATGAYYTAYRPIPRTPYYAPLLHFCPPGIFSMLTAHGRVSYSLLMGLLYLHRRVFLTIIIIIQSFMFVYYHSDIGIFTPTLVK